ncbi:MAG: SH3 domain-containing protein [Anaerolineae bacterium]|nr:SH3 domain-containing protein [Anaerolineae bacterium]
MTAALSATGCDLGVGRAAPTPTIVPLAAAATSVTPIPTIAPTTAPTEAPTATPTPLPPTDTPAPSRLIAIVTASALNVRTGPSMAYPIVGGLSLGDSVEVVGKNTTGDWLQIAHPSGSDDQGWIAAAYADLTGSLAAVPEVSAPPPPQPTPMAAMESVPIAAQAAPPAPALTGKLVFQVCNGCDIYVINADGSGLRRLTDGMEPAWSPDGKKVAFGRWRDPRGIYVIDEDGSNETLVFGWVAAKGPAWSPDGSRIAFTRWYGGRDKDTEVCFWGFCRDLPADHWWKLGVVRLEDGYFQDLRCYPHSLSPTWSADGSVIAYDSDFGIHLTNEEGTIGDVTDDRSLFAISTDGRDISPVWSPDGSRIAFGFRQHDHWEIYVMNADGSNRVRLTQEEPFAGRPPNNVSPAWSPDSRHIAFFTDRNSNSEQGEDSELKWELYVMNADGSNQRPMFETAPSTTLRTGLDGLEFEYGFVAERMVSWAE